MILHHKLGANQNEKFTSMQTRSVLTEKSKEKKLREKKSKVIGSIEFCWLHLDVHIKEKSCIRTKVLWNKITSEKSDIYGVAAVETPKWCWLLQVYAISILLHFIIISFEFAKLITMIFLYMYFCLLTWNAN